MTVSEYNPQVQDVNKTHKININKWVKMVTIQSDIKGAKMQKAKPIKWSFEKPLMTQKEWVQSHYRELCYGLQRLPVDDNTFDVLINNIAHACGRRINWTEIVDVFDDGGELNYLDRDRNCDKDFIVYNIFGLV